MPDLDRTWVDQFTMQMTIQRAGPDDISKALADVRSHCADSGQSAHEAFGDPKAYATTLAAELPPGPPAATRRDAAILFLMMLATTLLGVWSISILLLPSGGEVEITLGKLLLITVALPGVVGLRVAPWLRRNPRAAATPDRPAFDERYWRAVWLLLGYLAVGAALWIGLDQTLFTVSSEWLLPGLGLGLLVASQILRRVVDRSAQDPPAAAVQ